MIMFAMTRFEACGNKMLTALAALAASAVTFSASGQVATAPAADPMAAFKTDQGLISLTKAAPIFTPVSDYRGQDIRTRATLFGDPDGERSRLYEKGITLDAQVTQVYQGVTSGGNVRGNGSAEYNGLFEGNMTLDTGKLGWWSGGLFVLTEQSSWGRPLKSQAGNLSPVNASALFPEPFENSSVLMEYHLIQALPHDTLVVVGRVNPSNYLDQNSFAWLPASQFFNESMNANPLFGAFMSMSTYAALFMTKVSDSLTVAYGAWTPKTAVGEYDGEWNDYGVVINPQFKYKASNQPGAFQAILAYSSKDATDVGNPRLVQGLATGSLPTKSGNWIAELSGEQYFWTPTRAPVPTKDFAVGQPGFGMFYRISFTPADRNFFNVYVSGGVGGRGVIPGRPHDRFGVGGYWLKKSSDLDRQPGNLLGDEKGMEVFYNFAITPAVQLSIDVQWIRPAIRLSSDATVVGARLNLRF